VDREDHKPHPQPPPPFSPQFITRDPNHDVKATAIEALMNSLEFCNECFKNEQEQSYIMNTVFNAATQESDISVQVKAMACLVRIAELYYEYLKPYIQDLFKVRGWDGKGLCVDDAETNNYSLLASYPKKATTAAMTSEDPEKAKQGIEFWCSIAEVEIELIEQYVEAQKTHIAPASVPAWYAEGALPFVLPLLLNCMTLQVRREGVESGEW